MIGRGVLVGVVAAVAAAVVVGPVSAAPAPQRVVIGTGAKTCVLKAGADCGEVVHRGVEFHGNLKGVRLVRAKLLDANLKGANLVGANMSGINLKGANLDGANMKGANLGPVKRPGVRGAMSLTWVYWSMT